MRREDVRIPVLAKRAEVAAETTAVVEGEPEVIKKGKGEEYEFRAATPEDLKRERNAPLHTPTDLKQAATRDQRLQWWHEARFGMFIHWGLYSVIGQHEWARENEGVPLLQYELLAKNFHPKPNAARAWAPPASPAGDGGRSPNRRRPDGRRLCTPSRSPCFSLGIPPDVHVE